jgi:hypothetical protein
MPRPLAIALTLALTLTLTLALTLASACQGAPPPSPEAAAPTRVVWRMAPAPPAQAHQRVVEHLLTLEALSGPLIELAMRDEGRALCRRWGEEVEQFLTFATPDFVSAAQVKPLKPTDQRAIEDAYQRFGVIAARCMAGGEGARGALMRVKDLVKPMLRAI